MSNQDLIYLVFILNPFLKMNSISSFDFTTTSWTRLLQSPSSNSSTKVPCFSNAPMNPLNNSLWAFLPSICSEILSYSDLIVLYLSVISAYLLSYSFWSSAIRLFSAMAVCICSAMIIHYSAHPLCIFLANSLVKTSLSGPSGILHYFYFFLSAFFSRRCIQHQVLFRHTFDKILL